MVQRPHDRKPLFREGRRWFSLGLDPNEKLSCQRNIAISQLYPVVEFNPTFHTLIKD